MESQNYPLGLILLFLKVQNVCHEKRPCTNDASVSVSSVQTILPKGLHTVKTATEEKDQEMVKKNKNNNHLTDNAIFVLCLWTAADANLKCWHTRHQTQRQTTRCNPSSPLCLNTPRTRSCFFEVISDQAWLSGQYVCRQTHTKRRPVVFNVCFFFFIISGMKKTRESLWTVNMQPDQWLHQGVSGCRSIPHVGH